MRHYRCGPNPTIVYLCDGNRMPITNHPSFRIFMWSSSFFLRPLFGNRYNEIQLGKWKRSKDVAKWNHEKAILFDRRSIWSDGKCDIPFHEFQFIGWCHFKTEMWILFSFEFRIRFSPIDFTVMSILLRHPPLRVAFTFGSKGSKLDWFFQAIVSSRFILKKCANRSD